MGTTTLSAPRATAADAGNPPVSDHDGPPAGRPRRADVVASYDLGVENYEQLWRPVILPTAAAVVPWLSLDDHHVVLDVGAGTGALSDTIRSSAPTASVLALEESKQMLRVARTQRGLLAVRADAMALPVAAESVHAVVLAYVLSHLADPLVAVSEAARVLQPRGLVATVTWAGERAGCAQLLWDEALAEAGVPPLRVRRVDAGLTASRRSTAFSA
jgi:SAM-dependent methyltransferase